MTAPMVLRVTRGGSFVVGEAYPRERHGKPAIEVRRVRHFAKLSEALEAMGDSVATSESSEAHETPQDASATPSAHLKPATAIALRLLRERGSLTENEYRDLAGRERLAARVLELRKVYGRSAIETTYEVHDGSRYARYIWRWKPEQLELLGAA